MSNEEAIQLLATVLGSGLGSGLVVGILSWVKEIRLERQKRRNERVRVQIEKLYGPLYFFSSQNEALFELVGKIHSAYGAEYSSKNWSPSEHTQANLKKDTDATIQLKNSYVATATENSTAMVDILKSNYAYIDPEDVDVFRQFVLDQARLKQEFPAEEPK